MADKRIGRIEISEEELSRILGWSGGKIHYIGKRSDYADIGIVIEHLDLPLVPNGGAIPRIDRR